MEITIGQWNLMWCDAVFSLPGNTSRVMQSKKIYLSNYLSTASVKLNIFNSQHTTSWQDTESYSSTELMTSTGLPFATGSSTTPEASTSTRSFTSAGLSTIFQVSESSTTFAPTINIALSNSPGPSFTNGLLTTEGQANTLQPLISFGSSTGSVKNTEIPINKTRWHITMSWNRTINIDITKDDKDAEDSVSLAVVVTVILILVICTAVLSYLIRYWQVRKKLNAPPPFKPPPPPIKYAAIQVSSQGEVNC
ncbi:T-cell surface protein tactile [Pristis pectinata]|uniref:T-cell surface protein tactile n=1 Tax=Pristis pectinata TaxID=685728 RepID=UPI00223E3FD0|nr:T-cell surface protein tactile [Pristis pectinata]